jgi:pimeloyl-ACP methyl ester carboxylesterase
LTNAYKGRYSLPMLRGACDPGRRHLSTVLAFVAILVSCRATRPAKAPESWTLVDPARGRSIPVEIYEPSAASTGVQSVVLLSHGYGLKNTEYGFLARALAANALLVLSVQHDLPGDPPLATGHDLYNRRRPRWEEGVRNLRFVLAQARRRWPRVVSSAAILVGHSNGGDLSALMATDHPELISDLITLDHRRMPLPRSKRPRQLSLRAGEVPADPGVLPSVSEQRLLGIRVVDIPGAKHADLSDEGPESVQREVAQRVLEYLNQPRE